MLLLTTAIAAVNQSIVVCSWEDPPEKSFTQSRAESSLVLTSCWGEANIFISFWPKQQMNDTWLCTLALALLSSQLVADDFAQQQCPLPPTTRVWCYLHQEPCCCHLIMLFLKICGQDHPQHIKKRNLHKYSRTESESVRATYWSYCCSSRRAGMCERPFLEDTVLVQGVLS